MSTVKGFVCMLLCICISYDQQIFDEWAKDVSDISTTNLTNPLLVRNPTKKSLSVNFDPQVCTWGVRQQANTTIIVDWKFHFLVFVLSKYHKRLSLKLCCWVWVQKIIESEVWGFFLLLSTLFHGVYTSTLFSIFERKEFWPLYVISLAWFV